MERDTQLKKTLFACDELSGFVHACGLVRPNGLEGLEPKSVKKKLKQPSFAAGVHRDEVYAGELLGLELDDHIRNIVEALQPIAGELGLYWFRRISAGRRAVVVGLARPPAGGRAHQAGAGIPRTTTSAAASRCTVSVGSPGGRNETSVAWSAAVTTSRPASRSSPRSRCAVSRAVVAPLRTSRARPRAPRAPVLASSPGRSAVPRPAPRRSPARGRTSRPRSTRPGSARAPPGSRTTSPPVDSGPHSHFWPEMVVKSTDCVSTGIAPTDWAPSTSTGTPVASRSSAVGSTLPVSHETAEIAISSPPRRPRADQLECVVRIGAAESARP